MATGDRRPRIPNELAERIDALRGNEPFEPFVRRLLSMHVLDLEQRRKAMAEGRK